MLWTCAGALAFALVWELAARAVGSELILPGPLPTARVFLALLRTERFLSAALGSTLRVAAGLALAVPVAALVGIAAGLDARARAFVRPFFSVVAATPVLSIILIALLWFGQERTPVFTSFLMVFPVMAANATEGVRAADERLVEAARVYGLSRRSRLRHLYLPTLAPYLAAGIRSSLSLCWKVVVAAEVIAQPARSLGAGMQSAKAMLETTELFAWTTATVFLAALTEFALGLLRRRGDYGPRR
jgi:NitT/TauT family transport system permease protein